MIVAKAKKNIHEFILEELNSFFLFSILLTASISILANKYSQNFQKIAIYLTKLHSFFKTNTKKFRVFKKKAIKFKVQGNQFFCIIKKNMLMHWVVNNSEKR